MARLGRFAPRNTLEEQVRCYLPKLVDGLTNHGQRGLKHVGHFEIVEANDGDLPGDIDTRRAERVQDVAHGEVIGREESGGRLSAVQHGADKGDGSLRRATIDIRLRGMAGVGHGFTVTGIAGLHGVELTVETKESNGAMAVADEVLDGGLGASAIGDENGIEARSGCGTVHSDDVDAGERFAAVIAFVVRNRDDDEAVDLAAEHQAGLFLLDLRVLIGGGEDDGVAVLLGYRGDSMSAGGKEGIVEVRNNDADGFGVDGAETSGNLVRLIVEDLDGAIDALGRVFGNAGTSGKDAGHRHLANAGETGDVGHRCVAL